MTRLPRSVDDLRGRRAARWIRESTRGQYDHNGPDVQRRMQDGAIARFGLVDTGLSWSPAHSGRTVYQAPAMRAMLDAARAGQFDVLLVGYVARWQRNLRQTLNLLEDDLHPAGVAVWFCDEELLSSSERAWDQLVDEAKAADSWLRRHRRRVTEGLESKRLTRRDPGGHPPFGFRRNAAKLVEPDPDRAGAIARVFELSADGYTDRDVAALTGVPLFTVRGMLTSPLFVGRLRDGGPANWPPLVDMPTWQRVQTNRARRATNAGRPADPRRPYALSMLRCLSCDRRLTGDTGYYRHAEPTCDRFIGAPRPSRRGWRGTGYRREFYEAAIELLLERVAIGADTLTEVVADLNAPPQPDRLALARIERERDAALARYRRDRDGDALVATMARLDDDQRSVAAEPAPAMDPADVVEYLRDLPRIWREAPAGRRRLAEYLFERVDVLGEKRGRVTLTKAAIDRGFADVIPAQMRLSSTDFGNGRGERSSTFTIDIVGRAQPLRARRRRSA